MSPTSSTKRLPQPKPGATMERRRDGQRSVAAAEAAGLRANSAEQPADGAESTAGAGGAEGGAGMAAADLQLDVVEKAIIGQELVPVEEEPKRGQKTDEETQKESKSEMFETPGVQRPQGSPDQLRIQNSPHTRQNDESSRKGEQEEQSLVPVVPNGPPVVYGPSTVSPLPLFTPEQVAQLNDPRASSSMLPLSRPALVQAEPPLLPGFLQGLLPGFDQLQSLHESRQREMEWRANMELMVEQLGLQLRASQTENLRLRQELYESRKEPSRYGTPEEISSSGRGEVRGAGRLFEDGVVSDPARWKFQGCSKGFEKEDSKGGWDSGPASSKKGGRDSSPASSKKGGWDSSPASSKKGGRDSCPASL